jgi:hypothetical protein
MSFAQAQHLAPCRFRGEHPTVMRPASRLPLLRGSHDRSGGMCTATRRGLRASHRLRMRDTRYRRPAARNSPPKRTS